MICFPNCKINLGLFVTEKRPDGFHNIETVFYPVQLCDILEIVESKNTLFTSSGIHIPGDAESNLCLKAYKMLKDKYSIPDINMHLHKAIPTGAGLGGGSADAAFTIRLLNETFALGLSNIEMQEMASKLGSDCAFFIENKPVFATGRGNEFEPIPLDLSKYHLLLVKPDVHMSTPEAYSLIKPAKAPVALKEIGSISIYDWKTTITNDFEAPVFNKFPEIKTIKDKLYDMGAIYASMSGSGSSLFGLYEKPVKTEHVFEDCFVWQGKLKQVY